MAKCESASHLGMKIVKIYTTAVCPYCDRAKMLFQSKNILYTEIRIENEPLVRKEMETLSGRRSVPQIFIGELHVGGFDDLKALSDENKLMPLLST